MSRQVSPGRCEQCQHPLDDHNHVYVATGGGGGRTILRCTARVCGRRCNCERELPPRTAPEVWNDLYDD